MHAQARRQQVLERLRQAGALIARVALLPADVRGCGSAALGGAAALGLPAVAEVARPLGAETVPVAPLLAEWLGRLGLRAVGGLTGTVGLLLGPCGAGLYGSV